MFEKLNDINWADFDAHEIPEFLRHIVSSPEMGTRQHYLFLLQGKILHQGTVFEVTSYVVPFLIELLAHNTFPDKDAVLWLLGEISASITGMVEGSEEEQWAKNAYNAVGLGITEYLRLLNDPQIEIRTAALYVLKNLGEHATEILLGLAQMLSLDSNAQIRPNIIWTIGVIAGKSLYKLPETLKGNLRGSLKYFLRPEETESIRLIASVAITEIAGDLTTDIVIRTIIDNLIAPASNIQKTWPGPFFAGDLCKALCNIDTERGIEALTTVLKSVSDNMDMFTAAFAALDVAFGTDLSTRYTSMAPSTDSQGLMTIFYFPRNRQELRVSSPSNLNQYQKRVIDTLLTRDDFWKIRSNLLQLFGLPVGRREVNDLLK